MRNARITNSVSTPPPHFNGRAPPNPGPPPTLAPARDVGTRVGDAKVDRRGARLGSASPAQPDPPSANLASGVSQSAPPGSGKPVSVPLFEHFAPSLRARWLPAAARSLVTQFVAAAAAAAEATSVRSEFAARFPSRKEVKICLPPFFGHLNARRTGRTRLRYRGVETSGCTVREVGTWGQSLQVRGSLLASGILAPVGIPERPSLPA